MRRMVEKILTAHGMDMTVARGSESFSVRGFFQPVTGKSMAMSAITPGYLGREYTGQYVYIGPMEPALEPGDELMGCVVRRAEEVSGCYVWAMCVRKGAEDTWST